ncbi:MAG: TaqI-like C-terminal specificity domain-containing protein, partial [Microcystaceae cyanobacterium]
MDNPDLWIIFTRRGIDINQYPAILKYLYNYKKQLTPGGEGGRKPSTCQWYEIQDPIAYWQEFETSKIVYPNICKRNEFTLDNDGYYINQKAFIIPQTSRHLLGILNSNIM